MKVHIKTLSNDHIEQFIRCPYKFYQQQLLLKKTSIDWKQHVQVTVHQIIKRYCSKPIQYRSKFYVLQLIEKYWRLKPNMFSSPVHYYDVLAKVSDYLLRFLGEKAHVELPLFVFEKYSVYVEEIQSNLSLTIDFAAWTENSYTVTKFILDDHEEVKRTMKDFIVVFSRQAFKKVPEQIHFYSLLTGKTTTYHIALDDYKKAILQLHIVKSVLMEPIHFQKNNASSECENCPLKQECAEEGDVPPTLLV
ncbi:hypothetical protein ACLHDF_13135 [Priestia aryabhattai]|uniref:hypothetical protein n=1 Tax=Priestia megaterium TaxID=1404 RepID=UPI0039B9CA68